MILMGLKPVRPSSRILWSVSKHALQREQRAELQAVAEDAGGRLWGIVHSHPDVGAYFSSEDREMAMGGGAEPLWPGVAYLVVSVRQGAVDGLRIYTWDSLASDFVEEQVTGVP